MTETTEREIVRRYLDLVESYTAGEMTASEFSREYMESFKSTDESMDDDTFWILQNLFAEADAYCEPAIRGDVRDAIDEDELEQAAREAATELERRLDELAR